MLSRPNWTNFHWQPYGGTKYHHLFRAASTFSFRFSKGGCCHPCQVQQGWLAVFFHLAIIAGGSYRYVEPLVSWVHFSLNVCLWSLFIEKRDHIGSTIQTCKIKFKWSVKTENSGAHLLSVALHNVVDLLELVGEPLLARELVLLQGQDQLLVVLHSIPEDQDEDVDDRVDRWLHERFSFERKLCGSSSWLSVI